MLFCVISRPWPARETRVVIVVITTIIVILLRQLGYSLMDALALVLGGGEAAAAVALRPLPGTVAGSDR